MNFYKPYQNIHFIGIGGIGVSAIAEILLKQGKTVTGSDMKHSSQTKHLLALGADIHIGHDAQLVENKDLVVYTAAVNAENPELKAAAMQNIPCITRAEALGHLMKQYPFSIAVSGTHGKTTTTSMLATLFQQAKLDPTILVGGDLESIGGNSILGSGQHLITEACEYKDSFLSFKPNCALVLNIEEDHLDYFENLEAIIRSFTLFAQSIPKNGHLILNHDDYTTMRLVHHVTCHVATYGFHEDATYSGRNARFDEQGNGAFEVFHNNQKLCAIELNIPGRHNISNALAAFAAAHTLGVDAKSIATSLKTFKNAKRRFEVIHQDNGITLIDDYAHHPNEIKATLQASMRYPHKRIIGLFQPHTYTRTHELLHEFATAFDGCDQLILTDIYAAREVDYGKVHTRDLVKLVSETGQSVMYLPTFEDIIQHLTTTLKPGDIVLCMGAGNINEVVYALKDLHTESMMVNA